MGILKHLLFWPVTGPSFLTRFSLEKVEQTVRQELTSDDAVKEELLALQMRLELGEIDDDEYVAEEAAVMQRLRDVRHWREEFGMGVSGGPVRLDRGDIRADATATESAGGGPEPETGTPAVEDGSDSGARGIASPDGASVELRTDWD